MLRIYSISGFRQNSLRENGSELIQRHVLAPLRTLPGVDVQPVRNWSDDWIGLAARAARDGVTRAIIFGYSWGGGWGAPNLAKHLGKFNVRVIHIGLCDAVYRPTWLPTWLPANIFAFRALVPSWPKIRIPAHVEEIRAIRQNTSLPAGHRLQWRGQTYAPILIESTHQAIDESAAWRRMVIGAVTRHLPRSASAAFLAP